MKSPKVEIKNLHTFKGHDGIGVNADVWINDVKCLYVHDGAYGGELDINDYGFGDKDQVSIRTNIARLEEYLIELAKEIHKPYYPITLEDHINDLIDAALTAKEKLKAEKKFEKYCIDSICFGIEGANNYQRLTYSKPLCQFTKPALELIVNSVKSRLKTGEVILNKNLQQFGINL